VADCNRGVVTTVLMNDI